MPGGKYWEGMYSEVNDRVMQRMGLAHEWEIGFQEAMIHSCWCYSKAGSRLNSCVELMVQQQFIQDPLFSVSENQSSNFVLEKPHWAIDF